MRSAGCIMVEALRATTSYAFEQLELARVFAVPFATTSRSARVLEKAADVREGVMRHSALDQVLYAAYADTALANAMGGRPLP